MVTLTRINRKRFNHPSSFHYAEAGETTRKKEIFFTTENTEKNNKILMKIKNESAKIRPICVDREEGGELLPLQKDADWT